MSQFAPLPTPHLPETTKKIIDDFLEAARFSFGPNLHSVVLYGSAAEGTLRPTSDINLILVLESFEPAQAEGIRPTLRVAQSAIQLNVMFLRTVEISAAVRSFAPKFADVLRRRTILFGEDPFAAILVPRDAEVRQLRQQLLNLVLRMRSVYVARGLREEQLAAFLAHVMGPIRKLAQSFQRLQEKPVVSAQDALVKLGTELGVASWTDTLTIVEELQAAKLGEAGAIPRAYLQVLDCLQRMRDKAETIGGG